mgnify:CR=1 FL=1
MAQRCVDRWVVIGVTSYSNRVLGSVAGLACIDRQAKSSARAGESDGLYAGRRPTLQQHPQPRGEEGENG